MTRGSLSLGALGCGLAAALILPGNAPGLGVFVVALTVSGVVLAARPTEPSYHSTFFGVIAIGLASMAVVRSAGWVVGIDLIAAASFASLAVAGGATWRGVVRGAGAAGTALIRGVGFSLEPLRGRVGPAVRGRAAPLLSGLAIGIGLLVVFGALVVSADRAFLHLATRLFSPGVEVSQFPARIYLFVLFAAFTGALIVIGPRYAPALEEGAFEENGSRRSLGPSEWGIALGLLNVLFATFVIVQLTVLFGGRSHVLDTVNLSYAEYARAGFFQLVAVALLVLAVIAASVRWARADSRGQVVALRVMLGLLCVLTLVVLGSALKRLMLYEDVFGLTRLRISVHATILCMALVFLMLIIAGLLWRGDWLPRAFAYLAGVSLLVFSLANPDALIARQNAGRFQRTGNIDVAYLQTLSADAAGSLGGLDPGDRVCVLRAIGETLTSGPGWASFNFARARALSEVQRAETSLTAPCTAQLTF
ncbi:MAG TPA: DUF4173 domain-containing protein [Actinomycetota bacterium]|nr:DUF4173 domain-containing protein [Actinomycetota bacterium]